MIAGDAIHWFMNMPTTASSMRTLLVVAQLVGGVAGALYLLLKARKVRVQIPSSS